jgi:hypothetical protein
VIDVPGRMPLPAKITIDVLPPIDLAAEIGPSAGLDAGYDLVTRRTPDAPDGLAGERELPLMG